MMMTIKSYHYDDDEKESYHYDDDNNENYHYDDDDTTIRDYREHLPTKEEANKAKCTNFGRLAI